MGARRVEEQSIRSVTKNGTGSYSVTLPIQFVRKLRWQNGQKVSFSLRGNKLVIEDFEE